jgi:adenosylhomocysteine nucleosidase
MKRIILFTVVILSFSAADAQGLLAKAETDTNYFPVKQQNIIAIIGAFETEVQLLKNELSDKKEKIIEGIRFYTGTINGQNVVVSRIGIGKVNAAIATTLLLEHFRPKAILFSGIAGAVNPDLHPGDIVVAKQIAHHDYGRITAQGFQIWATQNPYHFHANPVYFKCDSVLLTVAEKAAKQIEFLKINNYTPKIFFGTIITGDVFLADNEKNKSLRKIMNADAIEMEGAAVAQVCYQQKVKFLTIRSLSDDANDSATLDFVKYGKMAAENSAQLVMKILKLMQ